LSDNFTLKDTVSGSKWQLNNGAVISGPASLALKQYNTLYDNGTGVLNIRN
jgi:Rieske Fe-S protein